MKLARLIGILSILLQRESVTTPELAEKFEVSRRTILRDLEELGAAGIPIVTRQGAGGGVSLMEGYKIERTLLTAGEMQDILAGLRGLDSVNGTNHYRMLMEKLSAGSSDFLSGNQFVLIDLSSWYQDALTAKIEQIRYAIEHNREISFVYYAPKQESKRRIEPYYLIFRWASWYAWGWCKKRRGFRLFKLNRMDKLQVTEKTFEKRPVPLPDLSNQRIFPGGIRVKALFSASCKWRLVEEFGAGCFVEQPDGKLLFHADYTDKENLLSWLLTFRDQAELLEPADLRQELRAILENMHRNYEKETADGF